MNAFFVSAYMSIRTCMKMNKKDRRTGKKEQKHKQGCTHFIWFNNAMKRKPQNENKLCVFLFLVFHAVRCCGVFYDDHNFFLAVMLLWCYGSPVYIHIMHACMPGKSVHSWDFSLTRIMYRSMDVCMHRCMNIQAYDANNYTSCKNFN